MIRILAALLGLALLLGGVQTYRLDKAEDKAVALELAQAELMVKHQRKLREQEEDMRLALQQAAKHSLQEQKNAKAIHDKLLADLRSGERKLRDRFTCSRLPEGAGTPPGVDGEERTGLLPEDAAFLISEALRADLTAIERNELIDIVTELRKVLNERD